MTLKYFFLPEMVLCVECIKKDMRTKRMEPVEDVATITVDEHDISFMMQCPRCKAKGRVKMPIHTGDDE